MNARICKIYFNSIQPLSPYFVLAATLSKLLAFWQKHYTQAVFSVFENHSAPVASSSLLHRYRRKIEHQLKPFEVMPAKFFDAITQIIFLVPAGYFAVLGKSAVRPSSIPRLCFPHTFFEIFRDFSSSCAAVMEQADFKARIRRIVSVGF